MPASPLLPQAANKHVLCISWIPSLGETRGLILKQAGFDVTSIVGTPDASELKRCRPPDLLVLGHSVPQPEKRRIIATFRQSCDVPVLSLLAPHQAKLPEADYGIEAHRPEDFVESVREILLA